MSENKKRSIPEIQSEYQNLCLKAGHLQYQVYTFSRDLEMVNQELRDLNLEAAAVKAVEEAPKAEQLPAQPDATAPTPIRKPRASKVVAQ